MNAYGQDDYKIGISQADTYVKKQLKIFVPACMVATYSKYFAMKHATFG